MKVENYPIGSVIPYARNPRKNDDAATKVAASIKEFGWQQPIVVDADMVIIAGHTRLLAAQRLGLDEVPVAIAAELSAVQVKAYRLADNRVSEESSWDSDLVSLELSDLNELQYDLEVIGFDASELGRHLNGRTDIEAGDTDILGEWEGMPDFDSEDKTSFRRMIVHFKDAQCVDDFAKLINQKITPKTRSLWFPFIEIETTADKNYE